MWGISTQSSITGHKQLRVNVEHTRSKAQQQKKIASFYLNKAASCKITSRCSSLRIQSSGNSDVCLDAMEDCDKRGDAHNRQPQGVLDILAPASTLQSA